MNLKKLPSKKIYKLSYISPNIIRQLYLLQDSTAYNDEASVVNSRNSVIPPIYADRRVKIYTGRGYVTREISRWAVGFKFGEFTWNRKLALYKAKQLRKKKKK